MEAFSIATVNFCFHHLCSRGGGLLHYKRLMGMCGWMGRIFNRVTRMGGIQNGKILGLKKSEICCLLNLTISLH